ncbi:MAG: tetratricopeptide repeat protein [Planctomycetota bacterium]
MIHVANKSVLDDYRYLTNLIFMHWHSSDSILLAITILLAASGVKPHEPDISEDLARARKAWELGDELRHKASCDFQLIEQQENAYEQAEESFRNALKKDPKHPHALADFGRFWLTRREYGQARSRLEAAQNSPRAKMFTASELADIYRMLGGLFERAGDNDQALDYYKKALDKDPDDTRNLLSFAIGLCATGKPQEATELLKPWTKKNDIAGLGTPAETAMRTLGYYTFAVALEETGFLDEALRNYNQALKLAQTADIADNAGVADRAGMALERLEEIFDARQVCAEKRAKENDPRKEKLPQPPDEREEYAKAAYHCDEGLRWKKLAISDSSFNIALLRLRNRENIDNADAESIEKHPSFDPFLAAMQSFQEAIAKHPKMARAYYELGLCNLLLGRFSKARSLLDAAVIYSPNNLASLQLQGETLLELGQWQDAATAFKKALFLDPESGRANFGLARAYAGWQYDECQCRAALVALDRALQLGLRDRRIFPSQMLLFNDGRQLEGNVREEGTNYVVQCGNAQPLTVPKTAVKEVFQQSGLRGQLNELLARFERGEKPAPGPILRSSKPKRDKPDSALRPWSETIFEN